MEWSCIALCEHLSRHSIIQLYIEIFPLEEELDCSRQIIFTFVKAFFLLHSFYSLIRGFPPTSSRKSLKRCGSAQNSLSMSTCSLHLFLSSLFMFLFSLRREWINWHRFQTIRRRTWRCNNAITYLWGSQCSMKMKTSWLISCTWQRTSQFIAICNFPHDSRVTRCSIIQQLNETVEKRGFYYAFSPSCSH